MKFSVLFACVISLSPWLTASAAEKPAPANEPFLGQLSLPKATAYLDAGAHAHEDKCFACHSTFTYFAARSVIGTMTSTRRQTRQALEEFATKLAGEKLNPRDTPQLRVSETVLAAAVLAQDDAAGQGKLSPPTRKALDRTWELQRDDGGWNWIKHNEPPSGIDDHFGVTMAAIAVAHGAGPLCRHAAGPQGPGGHPPLPSRHPAANMHQRAMLLLAAAYVEDLLTSEQRKQSIADLFALQHADGGWAMPALGDWKREDGGTLDRTASDGYGTGFAIYVLRRGGRVAADDPRLQKGLLWLKTHQRASGDWFTRSPHKSDELSTYEGTAYAILALNACGAMSTQRNGSKQ